MQSYTVYQMDYVSKTKIPIGAISERRKVERGNNFFDLLRLARKRFANSPEQAFAISLGMTKVGSRQYS